MDPAARIVAEAIGDVGYQVTVTAQMNGQPMIVATGRDGKKLQVVGENELTAITELSRRLLLETMN